MTSRTPISRLLAKFTQENNEHKSLKLESNYSDFPQDRPAVDCLSLSEFEWMIELPKRSYEDCTEFLNLVGSLITPKPKTAFELLEEASGQLIPTMLPDLNIALKGGLCAGHLIEIAGRTGTGKTQWCMSLSTKLSIEEKKGTIYFDTERRFSPNRFMEIVSSNGGSEEDMQRIRVVRAENMTCFEILSTLKSYEPSFLKDRIGLLILDSINAAAYVGNATILDRQASLTKLAAEFKKIADAFQIPFVLTNQSTGYQNDSFCSLGTGWYHFVNTRLFLSATEARKTVTIVKSPMSNEYVSEYMITSVGVCPTVSKIEQVLQEWKDVFANLSPAELESL